MDKIFGKVYLYALKKTPVYGDSIPGFGVKLKRGVVRIMVTFQTRLMFRHINGKTLPVPFE